MKLDCYRGFDLKKQITIDVEKMENKPKEPAIEDPGLRQPSLMEQMMGACQQENLSDEEVEEDTKDKDKEKEKEKEKDNDTKKDK